MSIECYNSVHIDVYRSYGPVRNPIFIVIRRETKPAILLSSNTEFDEAGNITCMTFRRSSRDIPTGATCLFTNLYVDQFFIHYNGTCYRFPHHPILTNIYLYP